MRCPRHAAGSGAGSLKTKKGTMENRETGALNSASLNDLQSLRAIARPPGLARSGASLSGWSPQVTAA